MKGRGFLSALCVSLLVVLLAVSPGIQGNGWSDPNSDLWEDTLLIGALREGADALIVQMILNTGVDVSLNFHGETP